MKHVAAIVLAAGKGTRMKCIKRNKVTFAIRNRPLISYTIDTLHLLHLSQIIVVVGYAKESVMDVLGNSVEYAMQRVRLGTGHAVKCALRNLKADISTVVTLYGDDSAFYKPELIKELLTTHHDQGSVLTLVTINKDDPTGLGRIIRNSEGQVAAIVEEKNATTEQKRIKEINTGLFCFNRTFLTQAIQKISKNPVSKEYYLTDLVAYAKKQGYLVHTITWPDASIWHGVNTPDELQAAEVKMAIPLDV